MEIKATLNKPYTEEEKINFIITQNHNKGYEIRGEQPETLTAWGHTEEEKLSAAKTAKYAENDSKAEQARTSKTFTLTLQNKTCEFDTKAQTQTDLLTAFAVCSQDTTYDGWICNNGIVIDLTLSDVTTISVKFKELSNVYPLWNYYKGLIDNAMTLAEVNAIVIDYDTTLNNV